MREEAEERVARRPPACGRPFWSAGRPSDRGLSFISLTRPIPYHVHP
jgi:hypothetical protein